MIAISDIKTDGLAQQVNHQGNSEPTIDSAKYWEASGLQGILNRCCAAFGVTPEDVRSRSRNEAFVFARQAYCYMAYRQTRQSSANIGLYIDRDHSTVSHSVRKVEDYLSVNYRRFCDIFNMLLLGA